MSPGTRSVDDFLSDLDDVLEAQADVPVVDPEPVVSLPPLPAADAPTTAPVRKGFDPLNPDDWKTPEPVVPPMPTVPPAVDALVDDVLVDDEVDEDDDGLVVDEEEPEEPKLTKAERKAAKAAAKEAAAATPDAMDRIVESAMSLIHHDRGRQTFYGVSSFAAGYSMGMYQATVEAMTNAAQNADVVLGCTFGAGVLGLVTAFAGSKLGAYVCLGSCVAMAALTMAPAPYVVGAAMTGSAHATYWLLRRWMHVRGVDYGRRWPLLPVAWLAYTPAVSSGVALVLYGTN